VPTLVELVIWAEYVPFPLSVTGPSVSCGSDDENVTLAPGTGFPRPSATVAVAVVCDVPFAMTVGEDRATVTA
jgi:hypothetical protein